MSIKHYALSLGFRGVEIGADVLDQFTIEQVVAAKNEAKVDVVGLCAQNGILYCVSSDNCVQMVVLLHLMY